MATALIIKVGNASDPQFSFSPVNIQIKCYNTSVDRNQH